jgi:hypothetical protein
MAAKDLTVQVERDPAILELLLQQLGAVETSLAPVVKAVADSLLLAGQTAQTLGREQAEALRAAIADAAAKVKEISAAQQQVVHAQAQQVQVLEQARHATHAQQQQVAQAHQMAQQMAEMQRQIVTQQQQAAQSATQMAAQAQQVLATQQQMSTQAQQLVQQQQHLSQQQQAHAQAQAQQPPAQAGARPGTWPPPGLVQRPDASPEENEAIARAQQALLAARQEGGSQPEVGAAVFRVEHRLGQLTDIVRSLQQRVGQGMAAADGNQSSQPPPEKGGNGGGSSVVRFDTMVDFQSPSNFYRWGPKADVVTEGGVFVSTRRRPPNIGQEVLLRITLPGGAELESRALVEWTRPAGHPQGAPGFGARFVDLPSYARQLVDHFIAKRPPILFEQA